MKNVCYRIALCSAVLGAGPACAKDAIDLFVEDANVPPIYFKQQNQFAGSARELFEAFARSQSLSLHYQLLPPKRLRNLQPNKDRQTQCYFPDNPAWSHSDLSRPWLEFSQPVYYLTEGLYVLPADWNRSQWHPRVIGVVNGWTPVPLLADIQHKKYQVMYAENLQNLFAMLKRHRVDAVYANSAVTSTDYVLDIRLPHFRTNFRLSCRNGHAVISRFNRFLRQYAHSPSAVMLYY